MLIVGIRELKAHLSEYLRRVKDGERIVVSDRGLPVAVVSPVAASARSERLDGMLNGGLARWAGGRPRGLARPVRMLQGEPASETILTDRG